MKNKPQESVHVRLDMPLEKRRVILQAAIDSMELTKRYENLIRIRAEKDQIYTEFRRLLSGINRMVKEVRMKELPLSAEEIRHMPRIKRQSVMAPVVKKVEKVLKAKVKKVEEPKKKPSSIDYQIEQLQKKLQNL